MASSNTVIRKKRGRPATGTDPLVAVRLPPEMIAALDGRAAADKVSRSELIRRLVELGLAKGKGKTPR
ncbi:MAG: ribbon-helix-helix domain-containing protein [Reyranella sp.]|uniref:ribbon-helix-helix domain-containing protein n=1 Tax=Reyranella sp. TaxID=1929291 RepID=UPI003D114D65